MISRERGTPTAASESQARDGIDAGRRLVEQDQLRLVHQRAGQRELLLHAARQLVGQPRAKRRELRHVEQLVAAALVMRDAVDLGKERDVLVNREIAIQAEALRQVADPFGQRAMLPHGVVAEHADATRVDMQQTAHQADGGGLAAQSDPIRPNI